MDITIEGIFQDHDALCEAVAAEPKLNASAVRLAVLAGGGLAVYGFSMGLHHSLLQGLSSAVKLPLLYFLTMLITFPAFHFISLHLGSRNKPGQTLMLCANGAAITGILAASFAPISWFFMMSGSSYGFLVLLHVGILAFCSAAGAGVMSKNLKRLREKTSQQLAPGTAFCLPAWIGICAVVGTQLAYMLRPYLGSEKGAFLLLSTEKGNFYEALFRTIVGLVGA